MLLTLYILARNSPENLSRMLDSLLPWEACDDVEIVVGDNSDETRIVELIARRAVEFNGQLRCLKHACTLGYSANMLRGFEIAQGRYLWIVGCNDKFQPDALAKLKAVLAYRTDAILLFPVDGLKARPWPLERVYGDFVDLVKDIELGPLHSINSCVFRVDVARRYLAAAYEAASNLVPQTTLIASVLKGGEKLYFHPQPLIERMSRGPRSWDPRIVWLTFWMIYPDLRDQLYWNRVRGVILKDWGRWILSTECEGFPIIWPMVWSTISQFGFSAFPLAMKMTMVILRRKMRRKKG